MNKPLSDKTNKNSTSARKRAGAPTAQVDNTLSGNAPERIAKRMARAGLCSRREAERWIAEGRVKLNGQLLATPAVTVTANDRIEVDDKPVGGRERTRLWLFHKPAGTVTTNNDPDGRKTIFQDLPEDLPRLISVGRLDINTEGLLLMTNDGGLARVMELPSTGWLRRYRVRVHGKVDEKRLAGLSEGIAVDGILYGAIEAELEQVQGSNAWLSVALREGKNREIKKVMNALGLEVTRLIRISFGPFQLADLPKGGIREIRSRTLRQQLGERLIREADADFESPVLHHAPEVARTASKAAKQATGKKQKPARTKRGVMRDETIQRLSTSRPGRKSTRTADQKPPTKPRQKPSGKTGSENKPRRSRS